MQLMHCRIAGFDFSYLQVVLEVRFSLQCGEPTLTFNMDEVVSALRKPRGVNPPGPPPGCALRCCAEQHEGSIADLVPEIYGCFGNTSQPS